MTTSLKTAFFGLYTTLVLLSDQNSSLGDRFFYLLKALSIFVPIGFILESLNLWFKDNATFGTAAILMIFINMLIGAFSHYRLKKFKWRTLLLKTLETIVVTLVTYLVLELILIVIGDNYIISLFRTTLQVSTLLYPASKILKNLFIVSDGKHPPKWIMQKIYNFQDNGDLKEFLSTTETKENGH